jgi:hypothetical protein
MKEVLVRRLRLAFKGHALSPTLRYEVQMGFASLDMESEPRIPLLDASLTWEALRDLNLQVGQMKVSHGRQGTMSTGKLQMVDRSIVVSEAGLNRDVGVAVFSKDLFGVGQRLGYALGVYGGDGRNQTGRESGFLYAARLEGRPLGGFKDDSEADMAWEHVPRLSLGLSAAYNQNTNRPRSTSGTPYPSGGFDYLHLGADLVFKFHGFSFQGEMMLRKADKNTRGVDAGGESVAIHARPMRGGYVQAGQLLLDELELTARYGRLEPLQGNRDPSFSRSDELGGGINYYVAKHDLKIQGDYFYLPTGGFEKGAHQGRLQAQLVF